MALTYKEPGTIGFSRSPILYAVYDSTYADAGFQYTCDVYLWQSGSKPGSPTYELAKFPSPNGTAIFNIQSLARDYFVEPKYEFSSNDDTLELYVNCAVTLNWTDDAGTGTPVVLNEFFIMDGYNKYHDGINYLTDSHLGINYSSSFALRISADSGTLESPDCIPDELIGLTEKGYWMTDRPVTMNIPIDTSMRMCLKKLSTNIKYIVVDVNDRTEVIKTDISAYTKKITSFGVGGTEISAASSVSTITKWEVYGEDSFGTRLTQLYTFNVVDPCKYGYMNLQFLNRYGVWDNLILYGAEINSLNVDRTEVMSSPLNVTTVPEWDFVEQYGQFQMRNVHGRESLTVNTGWIDEDWNDIIKQLMLSEHLFDADTLQPYTINTSNLKIQTALNDKLINYTLELKYANTAINTVY